jgi:transposase
MKVELAYLRRMKYGRSSEKLEHAQLELVGGLVAQPVVEPPVDAAADDGLKSNVTSLANERKKREPRSSGSSRHRHDRRSGTAGTAEHDRRTCSPRCA